MNLTGPDPDAGKRWVSGQSSEPLACCVFNSQPQPTELMNMETWPHIDWLLSIREGSSCVEGESTAGHLSSTLPTQVQSPSLSYGPQSAL